MLGLMKRDLLVMKHQFHKRDILIMGCLIIFSFWGLGEYAMPIVGASCLIVVSGYCNTISICDAKTRWDEYESILPITLKKRVIARYIVCMGMLLSMLVFLFFINIILSVYSKGMHFNFLLLEFFAAYMQMLIAVPISLNKGGEKSSYVLCVFLSIIAIICWGYKTLGYQLGRLIYIINRTISLNILLITIGVLGTIISYKISLKYKSQ